LFASTWLRQVSPLLHMTTLTTETVSLRNQPPGQLSLPSLWGR